MLSSFDYNYTVLEFLSFFLCYLNFEFPAGSGLGLAEETENVKNSGSCSQIIPSYKLPLEINGILDTQTPYISVLIGLHQVFLP